jgi:hypothetical protein
MQAHLQDIVSYTRIFAPEMTIEYTEVFAA